MSFLSSGTFREVEFVSFSDPCSFHMENIRLTGKGSDLRKKKTGNRNQPKHFLQNEKYIVKWLNHITQLYL